MTKYLFSGTMTGPKLSRLGTELAESTCCTYGSVSCTPLRKTCLSRISMTSPGSPMTRLMKSLEGSSGKSKTMTSPCLGPSRSMTMMFVKGIFTP